MLSGEAVKSHRVIRGQLLQDLLVLRTGQWSGGLLLEAAMSRLRWTTSSRLSPELPSGVRRSRRDRLMLSAVRAAKRPEACRQQVLDLFAVARRACRQTELTMHGRVQLAKKLLSLMLVQRRRLRSVWTLIMRVVYFERGTVVQ